MPARSFFGRLVDRVTGRAEARLREEEQKLARERERLRQEEQARLDEEMRRRIPPVDEIIIAPADATEKWAAGAFVLDVREPYETAHGIVPAARVIPVGQLERRLDEIPADREIVIYCAAGVRSLDAACLLYMRGFTRVYSVDGGISRWRPA